MMSSIASLQQKGCRAALSSSKTTTTRAIRQQAVVGVGIGVNNRAQGSRSLLPPSATSRRTRLSVAVQAEAEEASSTAESAATQEPRDDDVLPDSLSDALSQAGAATADAFAAASAAAAGPEAGGAARALVEVLLPDLWDPASGAVFAEEGDQQRFWKLTRRYCEELVAASPPGTRVRALYPDAGVAAMLKSQWSKNASSSSSSSSSSSQPPPLPLSFDVAAITDRTPVRPGEDDVVVLAAPDPQSLAAAVKAADAARDAGVACAMFNPRLVSGDVGIGLNVRRLRDGFLSSFTTCYALRPIGEVGTVYKRWPGRWQVFVEDEEAPGRYKLANKAGYDVAPAGEALDLIFERALAARQSSSSSSGSSSSPNSVARNGEISPRDDFGDDIGVGARIGTVVKGIQRFMRQLSQ